MSRTPRATTRKEKSRRRMSPGSPRSGWPQPAAALTASPAVVGDVIHIGVSGVGQEVAVANDNLTCCSFRGSEVAVNARTGAILWKTFMAPSGYTGTAIWGSDAVVDARRKS